LIRATLLEANFLNFDIKTDFLLPQLLTKSRFENITARDWEGTHSDSLVKSTSFINISVSGRTVFQDTTTRGLRTIGFWSRDENLISLNGSYTVFEQCVFSNLELNQVKIGLANFNDCSFKSVNFKEVLDSENVNAKGTPFDVLTATGPLLETLKKDNLLEFLGRASLLMKGTP